jgi:hypothetical protein
MGFRESTSSIATTSADGELNVGTLCRELDWQVSSLEQVCTSLLASPFHVLEDLYIHKASFTSNANWRDSNIENTLWLELFHTFTNVKNLYLSNVFAPHIVPALQELVGSRTLEVLPTLQNIFLERRRPPEPVPEGIGQFVAARHYPIAITRWERKP